MQHQKKPKSGINKPLICSRCGKRIGYVSIKPRLKKKMIFWGLLIALGMQLIAELVVQLIFKS